MRHTYFKIGIKIGIGGMILLGIVWGWAFLSRPTVSVVMPTYNRAGLLPRAIESILAQTYDDFEFIIVDDGSDDNSAEILESYAAMDDRIRILYNDRNRGISYSRNKGNEAARGKYIAIMDSDDIAMPDRLAVSVAYLENHPDITAVNSIYTKTTTDKVNNWVPPKRLEILMNIGNYYTHPALIRRDFLVQNHIRYNESFVSSEDYDLWRQIIFAGGQLDMINKPLMIIRRHRTNSNAYYDAIVSNRKKVSAQFLARFGIAEEEIPLGRCHLLGLMQQKNPEYGLVDQDALEFTYKKECMEENLPDGTLYIKHSDYLDHFIPDGLDGYRRESTGERATILYRGPYKLVLLWEDGREETFLAQENSWGLQNVPDENSNGNNE